MLYVVYNGAMQTTAAPTKIGLVAATIKTLLQVKSGGTKIFKIKEYGISFDGSAAATPGIVELIETDVAATVTAFVANDITKLDSDALNAGDPTTDIFSVGTAASGFTASAEGAVAAVRNLDGPQLVAPTNQWWKQFPLGDEPVIQNGKFGRIRCTFPGAVNALCWLKILV